MTDNTEGSQSKPVVLASSVFLAGLGLFFVYLLFRGPDPESVFPFFRSGLVVYPLGVVGAVLFGRFALIGFKRAKSL